MQRRGLVVQGGRVGWVDRECPFETRQRLLGALEPVQSKTAIVVGWSEIDRTDKACSYPASASPTRPSASCAFAR